MNSNSGTENINDKKVGSGSNKSSVTVTTEPATNITATSVKLNGTLSASANVKIKEHGAYLGVSESNMQKVATDNVNYNKSSLKMYYTVSGVAGSKYYSMLVPNTTYYFKEYAIIEGIEKPVEGATLSFKTSDYRLNITSLNQTMKVNDVNGTGTAPSHITPYGGATIKTRYSFETSS